MPASVPIAAFIFGAILTLVALVGGNITIFGTTVTGAIGRKERIVAGFLGILLIVIGLTNPFESQNILSLLMKRQEPTTTATVSASNPPGIANSSINPTQASNSAPIATPQSTALDSPIFIDTFDSQNYQPEWLLLNGNPAPNNGILTNDGTLFYDTDMPNYQIELKGQGDFIIFFRAQKENGEVTRGYQMGCSRNACVIFSIPLDHSFAPQRIRLPGPDYSEHELAIRAEGKTFTIYINDEEWAKFQDERYPVGGIAITTHGIEMNQVGGSASAIDYLEVAPLP